MTRCVFLLLHMYEILVVKGELLHNPINLNQKQKKHKKEEKEQKTKRSKQKHAHRY